MNSKTKPSTSTGSFMPFESFTIERREIVATIEPSRDGTIGPLQAAFAAAGEYIADHDDVSGTALEWTVWGRTFRASVDPDPALLEASKPPSDEWPL